MTPLPSRRLGRGGPSITTVGFGAWAIGGGGWAFAWGPQDDEAAIAAMRHAVSRGVGWIDTAAVYGYGHSEELVGRALAGIPKGERPLVFTKCGLRWNEQDRMAMPVRDLRPGRVREECLASLRRLGVEAIDLYQFHWPDETGTAVEDSWAEMLKLVDEGKTRFVGVSNFDVPLLERCAAVGQVQSLQPPFSLVRRDVGGREIPWCSAHETGVIVYSPMQSGLLTDSFSAGRVQAMAEDDWRRRSPEYQPPRLQKNLALRDALRPIAARHGVTTAAVAVAWTLAWPITAAIVGARSPQQVDGWLPAATLQALSSAYVERRERLQGGAALDGAGKRAAFALYYGPLHFLLVREIVRALSPWLGEVARIVDLGCGTGSAGAAWALEQSRAATVDGVDSSGWAVAEAAWTLRELGLRGETRRCDAVKTRFQGADGVLAAFTLNELGDEARALLQPRLLAAARDGSAVLVVEPIARRTSPWWPAWAAVVRSAGGREDEWRIRVALPASLALLAKAAGLDARELTARSFALPRRGRN